MTEVILASTSRYRAQLLQRLKVNFSQHAPECDETPKPGESPTDLVTRLAQSKALSVAERFSEAVIIGSDQVACVNSSDEILGKPGSHTDAVEQLQLLSGQTVSFHTGVSVMRYQPGTENSTPLGVDPIVVSTEVQFKHLDDDLIERYLLADKPYDCAASFRSESCGSWIVERMSCDDPTAIIGLPLIETARLLQAFDISFK